MARFQQPGIGERLSAAASAKEVALKRFRARGDVNDPEVLRRRAKRLEQAQARDVRLTERKRARETQDAAELRAREAKETTEKAERDEREALERAEQASRKALWSKRRKLSATPAMRRGRSESSSAKKARLANLAAHKAALSRGWNRASLSWPRPCTLRTIFHLTSMQAC